MLDHPGAIQVPTGALKWPKTAPKWPRLAQNHQNGSKCHCMTPNDPKTLPMGILHDYMSCWSTLGPFRYPRGPQNDPKQHQKGLEWLKITRMAQNVTAWLQMTLNTSNGYITWLYVMLDHPGPFSEAHRGPIMAQNSTKNGPPWPKMALHYPKWS